jgi:inward rectifier potassium channel
VIVDASAKLWLMRSETSAEGVFYRRFVRLPLLRDESPMFALSWTIMHVIDAQSPLRGWSAQDFAESDASLVVILEGHDETASQTLRARRNYPVSDVRYGREYDDMMRLDETGLVSIDYSKMHDTHDGASAL